MKISYNKLFEKLKRENIEENDFREYVNLDELTMQKLRKNESITADTICYICDYFQCMPDEIIEWIPNKNNEQIKKERQEIMDKITKLKEKLRQIGRDNIMYELTDFDKIYLNSQANMVNKLLNGIAKNEDEYIILIKHLQRNIESILKSHYIL